MPREAEKKPLVQEQITAQDTFRVTTPDMKVKASTQKIKQFNPEFYLLTNFHLPKQRTQMIQAAEKESSLSTAAKELGAVFGMVGSAVDKIAALQEYQKRADRAEAEINAEGGDYSIEGRSRAYAAAVEEIKGKHDAVAFKIKAEEIMAQRGGEMTTQELNMLLAQEFNAHAEGRSKNYLAGFAPSVRKIMAQATIEHATETAKRVKEDVLNGVDAFMMNEFNTAYKNGTLTPASGRAIIDRAMADGIKANLKRDDIAQRAIEVVGNMARYNKDPSLLNALFQPDANNIAIANTKHGQRVSQLYTQIEEMNIREAEAAARRAEASANKQMMANTLASVQSIVYGGGGKDPMAALMNEEKALRSAVRQGNGMFTVTRQDGTTQTYSGKEMDKMLSSVNRHMTMLAADNAHPVGDVSLATTLAARARSGALTPEELEASMPLLSKAQQSTVSAQVNRFMFEGLDAKREAVKKAIEEAYKLPIDPNASPVARANFVFEKEQQLADIYGDDQIWTNPEAQKKAIERGAALVEQYKGIRNNQTSSIFANILQAPPSRPAVPAATPPVTQQSQPQTVQPQAPQPAVDLEALNSLLNEKNTEEGQEGQ